MRSHSGRYTVVFNGEIYNFEALRAELSQHGSVTWSGHSDTEVLLAAIERWGIDEALTRVVGMYALGLWDADNATLHLARDRMGEKPLYYGWAGRDFVFASELKAIKAHPNFRGRIDRTALAAFMRYSNVPAPLAIFEGVYKLPPANTLSLSAKDINERTLPSTRCYWSLTDIAVAGSRRPLDISDNEAIETLDSMLGTAIAHQMTADVPVGAFLSGGVDSSTVAALMQHQSRAPIRTFSIGFDEIDYNEAPYAKAIAAHLGTQHTELYVSAADMLSVVPKLPTIYDEPFADSSQVPTYLVSQLASHHVKVCLSGDGGDELFGGYNRYSWGAKLWKLIGVVPPALRRSLAKGITSMPAKRWDGLLKSFRPVLPKMLRQRAVGDKLHKLARIIDKGSSTEIYESFVTLWPEENIVIGATRRPSAPENDNQPLDLVQRMMLLDSLRYLPDDILVKVDRAAMAVSLETRVPFLDHQVVEFAWQLPNRFRSRDGRSKWIVRNVLERYVPRQLFERNKMGFSVPLDSWLRGPLREWAGDLLSPTLIRRQGLLNADLIDQRWKEHQTGNRNWQHQLWNALMFQAWLEDQSSKQIQ